MKSLSFDGFLLPLTKKVKQKLSTVDRAAHSLKISNANPTIFSNSFPKSGTYLLAQILDAMPYYKNFGNFIATQPTRSKVKLCNSALERKIKKTLDGEIVLGHLEYCNQLDLTMRSKNIKKIFLYRDPRQIVISEANYLTNLNRFHLLSKYFRQLESDEERINLAIYGSSKFPNLPFEFGTIYDRMKPYFGWLDDHECLKLRYEDLRNSSFNASINRLLQFIYGGTLDELHEEQVKSAIQLNLQKKRSHTFFKGQTESWKAILTAAQKQSIKAMFDEELDRLGYE